VRVVGGEFKGRPIAAPPGRDTRPTSDRARESLFNILVHGARMDLADAIVLDVFAGSGALGLEALSRGAALCTFIENARTAQRSIEENLSAFDLGNRGSVLKVNATKLPMRPDHMAPAHLAFLDPPYGKDLAPPALTSLLDGDWLAPKAISVVETERGESFAAPAPFVLTDRRTYGPAEISFLHS